jgi:ferredoxin
MAEGATAYDPLHFSAADASFFTIEQLRPFVDGATASNRVVPDPQAMTEFVKRWGQKLGALSVGITELRDYHLYSVVGRGDEYGQLVELQHRFGIALTVEMDKRTLDSAPLGPAVMESAQQYVASGTIAVQMATFIRKLGYPARAHIDGNYRVVCPLVARDAGLGEIGRMGLLMTPRLGPRVRLAVVTTDLPLVTDRRTFDSTTIDFCERCKKCAAICPSGAISSERRTLVDGVKRWQIDSEACFTLWCQMGTDCARCVKVCPFSHPDNMLHNLVRLGVRHSSLVRELAVRMDDLLYGKHPEPSDLPDWQKVKSRTE